MPCQAPPRPTEHNLAGPRQAMPGAAEPCRTRSCLTSPCQPKLGKSTRDISATCSGRACYPLGTLRPVATQPNTAAGLAPVRSTMRRVSLPYRVTPSIAKPYHAMQEHCTTFVLHQAVPDLTKPRPAAPRRACPCPTLSRRTANQRAGLAPAFRAVSLVSHAAPCVPTLPRLASPGPDSLSPARPHHALPRRIYSGNLSAENLPC